MLYFIKIFFNLSLGNMLINLDNMLIFFSKRASGMLINDMLIKKHVCFNMILISAQYMFFISMDFISMAKIEFEKKISMD